MLLVNVSVVTLRSGELSYGQNIFTRWYRDIVPILAWKDVLRKWIKSHHELYYVNDPILRWNGWSTWLAFERSPDHIPPPYSKLYCADVKASLWWNRVPTSVCCVAYSDFFYLANECTIINKRSFFCRDTKKKYAVHFYLTSLCYFVVIWWQKNIFCFWCSPTLQN